MIARKETKLWTKYRTNSPRSGHKFPFPAQPGVSGHHWCLTHTGQMKKIAVTKWWNSLITDWYQPVRVSHVSHLTTVAPHNTWYLGHALFVKNIWNNEISVSDSPFLNTNQGGESEIPNFLHFFLPFLATLSVSDYSWSYLPEWSDPRCCSQS